MSNENYQDTSENNAINPQDEVKQEVEDESYYMQLELNQSCVNSGDQNEYSENDNETLDDLQNDPDFQVEIDTPTMMPNQAFVPCTKVQNQVHVCPICKKVYTKRVSYYSHMARHRKKNL